MTSTKNNLLWESAVSLILSTASIAVLTDVSNPMVKSVPNRSLSIVPGNPMIGIPCSSYNLIAPAKVPFPPIAISASISFS